MRFWETLNSVSGLKGWVIPFYGIVILAALFIGNRIPKDRRRMVLSIIFLAISAISLVVLASLSIWISGDTFYKSLFKFGYLAFAGIATVNIVSTFFFKAILRPIKIETPPIVRDLLMLGVNAFLVLAIMSQCGANLANLVATSAVATAVIGFALQDTLGNIIGGLVLQMDRSIQEGDWIRIDTREGVVREVRWRHTSIQTNDWNTVIIPNSQLMKSVFVVLGRREGEPRQTRREMLFNVDFKFPPSEVIDIVKSAFEGHGIKNVASNPKPSCIFSGYGESSAQFSCRYWLTDYSAMGASDSAIRLRIYTALHRAGINPAIPVFANINYEDTPERQALLAREDIEKQKAAIKGVSLFSPLTDEEITMLAASLKKAMFVAGETITHKGSVAHWLYILYKGTAEVRIGSEMGGPEHILATITAGGFFGEMGLLTGEPRSANVYAMSDCWCYRLDKDAFIHILEKRPELAEEISRLLVVRRAELEAVMEGLDHEAAKRRAQSRQADVLNKIIRFFKLNG